MPMWMYSSSGADEIVGGAGLIKYPVAMENPDPQNARPRNPSFGKFMYFRFIRTLAAASAGFIIACVVGARLLPAPDLPSVVREKIARLSTEGDQYDAIFLGSSRIQNHVMPALFDDLVARGGIHMKSFNFGIASMHAPEDDYVLDLILAQPHARLRWVFVEIDFFRTEMQPDQAGTLRGQYWHDLPRIELLCRRLFLTTESGLRRNIRDAFRRWNDFLDHGLLFCKRSANIGRGAQLIERHLFRADQNPMNWRVLGDSADGWTPVIPNESDIAERQSGRLGKILQKRIANPPARDEADSASQSILASLLAKIVKTGAMPVIVIPPRIRHYYLYPAPDIAARFPTIDLCDPVRYPELYREDLHVDGTHLNREGAVVFTRELAGAFLDAARKR